MTDEFSASRAELTGIVDNYRESSNVAGLLGELERFAGEREVAAIVAAAEPYLDIPEVAGPLYERVVRERPDDARALLVLANAYWLSGRGPEVVGEIAARAVSCDPENRGAWHMWALSESDPRNRVARWRQVVARFPDDDLARANLADNAAGLAGAEGDLEALEIAIRSYEELLGTATRAEQRTALESALRVLRSWVP